MKTKCWVAALAGFLMGISATVSAQAQDKTIKMGSIVYADVLPTAFITKKFLELEGFNVELTEFAEQGILFAALAKGDVEIVPTQINYVTHDHWKRNARRLEKISPLSHGVYQSLVVPSYVPIDSIEELPKIAGEVDNKIIGIETGSALYKETEQAIKAYGLDYQLVAGSTPAAIAQLQSALERKVPIVTMLWDPSWMMAKFDVKFLKDPKGIFAPPQTQYWIASKGFSANKPHAREVLASIYIPIEDVRLINAQVSDGMTMQEAADAWWDKNQDLIKRWQVMSSK
ncbi:glycine/betaine ABC transporter [Ventosimonas gracilis]|uniref:Glycine/betaine ABC transporter n=1 Tax=Ventosimonas gracilis TaxID=1680762 RepID=A0A139ST87_9GAMM|nr:glycine/betaine ABC transporter [Ventosimonas gracilis]